MAVTPDGQCCISASNDKTLKVWDLHSGGVLQTLAGHTGGVKAIQLSPDGVRVARAAEGAASDVAP